MAKITLKTKDNFYRFMRKAGYYPLQPKSKTNQAGFIRKISSGEYPRFHAYVKKNKRGVLEINLHLDQKKPVFKKSHSHAAEYDTQIVKKEIARIKILA